MSKAGAGEVKKSKSSSNLSKSTLQESENVNFSPWKMFEEVTTLVLAFSENTPFSPYTFVKSLILNLV